ncbi:MAG: histidinol-phosphate transaminase [Pseudomonadales bacterium]
MQALVKNLVRPELRAMQAYAVADPTGAVKLDAMENPYTWPADLKAQWLGELQDEELNRYPDPQANVVRDLLKANMQIPAEFDLLLGNGSDEIIQMLIMALAGNQRGVLAPAPGFVMYEMICAYTGLPYLSVDLEQDFDLDTDAMLRTIEEQQPVLIFLARPNNPTGNVFSEQKVRAIIEASTGLVVIDEAYIPFTETHALGLLRDYENLLVMRTLSKLGLAGVRLGMLIGRPEWIREVDKLRLPYNINVLTQNAVQFALRHQTVLDDQALHIKQDRAALYAQLQALPQLEVWASEANFFLFRILQGGAEAVQQQLLQQGVLIKNLHGKHRLLDNCLRVTVGTEAENALFLAALKASI